MDNHSEEREPNQLGESICQKIETNHGDEANFHIFQITRCRPKRT